MSAVEKSPSRFLNRVACFSRATMTVLGSRPTPLPAFSGSAPQLSPPALRCGCRSCQPTLPRFSPCTSESALACSCIRSWDCSNSHRDSVALPKYGSAYINREAAKSAQIPQIAGHAATTSESGGLSWDSVKERWQSDWGWMRPRFTTGKRTEVVRRSGSCPGSWVSLAMTRRFRQLNH